MGGEFIGPLNGIARVSSLALNTFLQLVPRTVDRETLIVQQATNTANHEHFMMLVVAAVATPLHGTQLSELLLPVSQNVRLDPTQISDLAYGEVALGRNGG